MIDDTCRTRIHCVTFPLQPPAKIYLLLVSKEVIVESAERVIQLSSHEHSRTTCPENWCRIVILTTIRFANIKYPSACERITKPVEPTPARARIFKMIPHPLLQQFRLAGTDTSVAFHHLNNRL